MTRKIALAAVFAVLALSVAQGAMAHRDPSPDSGNRCDTWWRNGHTTGPGTSHDHKYQTDVDVAGVANIHNHTGHYGVRSDVGYVEVIGGQGYRGPSPTGYTNPGQGGLVQGEIDAGNGTPDADFHANAFAPDVDHPPALDPAALQSWANGYNYLACVNVANSRLIDLKK